MSRKRWDAILDRLQADRPIRGVEIGVLNGNTSHRILAARPLMTHIMIDPWEVPAEGSSYAMSNDTNSQKSQDAHNGAYEKTMACTAFAGDRAVIIRDYAENVVDKYPDGSFDYIFIDGDHSYDGVKKDIAMWTCKVKKGGWIGGHDYDHPKLPGVKPAVDEAFPDGVELDDNRTWFKRL